MIRSSQELTVHEASLLLSISPQRVRFLAATGQLQAAKSGRDWLVRLAGPYMARRAHREIRQLAILDLPSETVGAVFVDDDWQVEK